MQSERDRRFREGYVLVLEFSNVGGVQFRLEGAANGNMRQLKKVDDPTLEKSARNIINSAYHIARKYSADVPPFGYWAAAEVLAKIDEELVPIRDKAERFNVQARKRGSRRELRVNYYLTRMWGHPSHDRVVRDMAQNMRRVRDVLVRGDLHKLKAELRTLYNVEKMLAAPLDHQFSAAMREFDENYNFVQAALKDPPLPSELPEQFREEYKINPARVFAQMCEWSAFSATVSALERTCENPSLGWADPITVQDNVH
jgi:hypothetical protein